MTYFLYLLAFIFGIAMFSKSIMLGLFIIIVSTILMSAYSNTDTERRKNMEEERIQNLSDEQRKQYYLDQQIDYTVIVGEDTRKSVGSAVARGAVGGALLGPIGLIGGALSGKNKSETTFTIIYKSGRREVRTVKNDSNEFRNYASYIK